MKPSYDDESLAAYCQPVGDELCADPTLGPLLRHLAQTDPDVLAAVADVDRSQIRHALELSPEHRIRQAFALTVALEGYHHAGRPKDRIVLPILIATLDEIHKKKP